MLLVVVAVASFGCCLVHGLCMEIGSGAGWIATGVQFTLSRNSLSTSRSTAINIS